MVAAAEEAVNGNNSGESCEWLHRGWRKLGTYPSAAKGVAHERSSGVESYAQKQRWWRKL